jgi:hypothetical protein
MGTKRNRSEPRLLKSVQEVGSHQPKEEKERRSVRTFPRRAEYAARSISSCRACLYRWVQRMSEDQEDSETTTENMSSEGGVAYLQSRLNALVATKANPGGLRERLRELGADRLRTKTYDTVEHAAEIHEKGCICVEAFARDLADAYQKVVVSAFDLDGKDALVKLGSHVLMRYDTFVLEVSNIVQEATNRIAIGSYQAPTIAESTLSIRRELDANVYMSVDAAEAIRRRERRGHRIAFRFALGGVVASVALSTGLNYLYNKNYQEKKEAAAKLSQDKSSARREIQDQLTPAFQRTDNALWHLRSIDSSDYAAAEAFRVSMSDLLDIQTRYEDKIAFGYDSAASALAEKAAKGYLALWAEFRRSPADSEAILLKARTLDLSMVTDSLIRILRKVYQ